MLNGGHNVSRQALAAVERAISNGKHVVTANKALIAEHGPEIFEQYEAIGVPFAERLLARRAYARRQINTCSSPKRRAVSALFSPCRAP